MIALLLNRHARLLILTPLAATFLGTGLSAETMTPQMAAMIFVGALIAGWALHWMFLGLVRGLFSFWTPLILLALLMGGPAAFSVFGSG